MYRYQEVLLYYNLNYQKIVCVHSQRTKSNVRIERTSSIYTDPEVQLSIGYFVVRDVRRVGWQFLFRLRPLNS